MRVSGHIYEPDSEEEMKKMESLKQLGFKFELRNVLGTEDYFLNDNNKVYLEINTIEELMDFVGKWGDIVLHYWPNFNREIPEEIIPCIEIYNDYRE